MRAVHHPALPAAILCVALAGGLARGLAAQPAPVPLSRAAAVDSAMRHGVRLGLARADSLAAAAQLLVARAFPNPTLNTAYSKATPNYHVLLDLPFELPGVRGLRVRAALLGQDAARHRIALERAMAALDADTAYTRAVAARALARLSQRNARDADSLRRIAEARRAAGDASDLDVEVATVAAGQAANVASADSLTYLSAVLDLQSVLGMTASDVVLVPTDTISPPPPRVGAAAAVDGPAPLSVAAAEGALQSAMQSARLQKRSVWGMPSLTAGFETGDPSGSEPGVLPSVGVAVPLPLFDRNRGPIAAASAEEQRARAELALAVVTSRVEVARARRELASALARLSRDQRLVASANRVASMSLTAYREGAASLSSVLEAQRSAREVLAEYINALADAWIADAELRVLTLTPASAP